MTPQPGQEPATVKASELVPGRFDVYKQVIALELAKEKARRFGRLQQITLYVLLGIFAVGNTATIALFFLNGFGKTSLTDVAMGSLAAATIAEVAGLLAIVITGLFRAEEPA